MRPFAGIDPEKLPVLAALAAAVSVALLLAGAVAVYGAVDLLGVLLIALFLLACLGLAASGWYVHWRALAAPSRPHPMVERRSPLRNAGQDSPAHRLLEAVAAEVKTSSATLAGFAEILPAGEGEARQHLLDGSRSLLAFASQFHDYIRFERGRLRLKEQQVDAGELVEAALASSRQAAEDGGTTITASLTSGIEVSCDAERLRQALASLVTWVVRSATPGSIVDVKLARTADHGLAFDIMSSDAASGMIQGRERMFEPQLSLTGLRGFALPIARRVALLHAGDVTVASGPGDGTMARLTLPAARVAWPDQHRPARAA